MSTSFCPIRLLILGGMLCAPAAALRQTSQDSDRDRWQQPERVMDAVGVRPGMAIGEVGAGRGYFTFKLAERVGQTGKVYANDIDPEALVYLERRCRDEGIVQVVSVRGEARDPQFPTRELDAVFMVYVLHQINADRPVEFLLNLKSYLKPGGTVVVLELDPEAAARLNLLPERKIAILLPKEETVVLFEESGYEFLRHETFLERDYISVFRVPAPPEADVKQ